MPAENHRDAQPLIADPNRIRLAMLGMVDGNGHPYSWSAIINGRYDAHVMAQCGYPVIPQYLDANRDALGIIGAQVTHVWCDDPADAQRVAQAAHIPHVVNDATDVIGQVDAVIVATDIGGEHVERVRPFIEAGLPAFIDKPLTDNDADLRQFIAWHEAGKALMSTSCMRYAPEFADLRSRIAAVGEPRLIVHAMLKNWDRYGIHALEGVYPFLAPGGWLSVSHSGDDKQCVVHARHDSGVEVVLPVIYDMVGGYAHLSVYGTQGMLHARAMNTFAAFKAHLVAFIDYLRSGTLPFDFAQTTELMRIIIAGIRSREQGGGAVRV